MSIPFFSALPPVRPERVQTPSRTNNTPARSRLPGQNTPNAGGSNVRKLYQSPAVGNKSDIVGQRSKILDYIKTNGQKSGGVSTAEIKRSLKLTNDTFLNDLTYLLGEGILYNTIDDDHYAPIE